MARTSRPDKIAEYEAQLSCPPIPQPLVYLWVIFRRLRRRKGGGFGVVPIEWTDIDAFCRHMRLHLAPWEIEVIEELDDLFLTINAPKPARAAEAPDNGSAPIRRRRATR